MAGACRPCTRAAPCQGPVGTTAIAPRFDAAWRTPAAGKGAETYFLGPPPKLWGWRALAPRISRRYVRQPCAAAGDKFLYLHVGTIIYFFGRLGLRVWCYANSLIVTSFFAPLDPLPVSEDFLKIRAHR